MAKKKYRIAIMGASGAGKTVFLGSYFNLVTNLGHGKPVSLNTPEADGEVGRIIRTLFKQQVPVKEKAKKDLISYSVVPLDMDASFIEVPEGGSPKQRNWQDHKFLPELKSADGVLFFLPADDLMKNPERIARENGTFQEALSFLLENNSSRWGSGEKVPVVFLFTKGDTVPDVSVEQLTERMIEVLGKDRQKSSALSIFLSAGSGNIKAFRVVAIGKWPDQKTLPREYEPQNVIKPMEELYKMMSSQENERRKIKSAVLAVVALLVVSTAVTWGMDHYRWRSTKNEARKLAANSKYEDALKIVDSFGKSYIFPDPIPLIPSALRGGADKDAFRSRILRSYEQALFDRLLPLIRDLDTVKMPDVTSGKYLDASGKVEEYLANSAFRTVNQANYDRVQSIRWYFEAGQALLGKTADETENAREAYSLIESWLDFLPKLPEQWKTEGAQKAADLFSFWADMVSPDAEIEEVEAFAASAARLSDNPNASEELKKLIADRCAAWKDMISAKWTERGAAWVQEASALVPEEGIEKIKALMEREGLPEDIGKTLSDALEGQYIRLAETLAGDEGADSEKIKGILSRYPEMPGQARQILSDRILTIAKNEVSVVSAGIEASESLEALGARLSDLERSWTDYPAGKEEVAQSFEKTFSRLVTSEWEKIAEEGAALADKKDFAGARDLYISSVETLTAKLEKAGLGAFGDGAVAEAAEVQGKKLGELRQAHLSACKSAFERLKSSKNKEDIAAASETLKDFASLWPDTEEGAEAGKTALFLDAASNGAKAVLTIVGGDFTSADSLLDTPDMKILLKRDGTTLLETKTADNEVRPVFGEKHEFTWDVDSRFTFIGIETGGILGSDKEVFNVTVDAGGIFGYEKLGGTLKNGGNSITIKLDIDLPESPWK
ncbi:hypothetical protein [Aminivibrio sp.]|jgi:hypothetical protein|uniref:hypothetical protein n=1 Tax=Aminivibrio sp. TaxID=1872489 RepID=UPI001A4DDE7F|nr:hypothetical protein [Aminivibrio sp.]MBL3538479.1 hypothetical protein [Aminivibrio sp.]